MIGMKAVVSVGGLTVNNPDRLPAKKPASRIELVTGFATG